MGGARCRSSSGRKKRDIHREKALYRCPRYHCERAHFFAIVNGGGGGRGGGHAMPRWANRRRRYQVLRVYALPSFRSSASLSLSLSLLPFLSFVFVLRFVLFFFLFSFFFFSFVRCPLESIPLDSFLTLAMGRPIATSAAIRPSFVYTYLPTYIFPIYFVVRGQGEPDLSPLNGINKLYYACTSP